MSIRPGRVNSIQPNRLEAVLAAGSNSTDMQRTRCYDYDYNSDDDEGPAIDWENSSVFKIEIFARSSNNTYEAGIFCDSEKHLALMGNYFKLAMNKNLINHTIVYDDTRKLGRYGNLRRYIHYKSDGKSVPFEQLKDKIDMEKLASEIKMFASSETHSIEYNKVLNVVERGYPPSILAVTMEGRLTVSKQAMT